MTRPRIGTVFLPGWAPEHLRGVARAAEEAGLDELWFWEDCFNESGPAAAAVALASTERITVGIGLMPVPLRQVAIAAMEIATLQRLFPGRFIPVIGHGVQSWMSQLGVKPASPLTLLTEYAVALRRLLEGDSVTVDGEYVHLDGVQLQWPPADRRLLIGGEGPKTLALAATYGDGTMLTSALSEDRIRNMCDIVHATLADRADGARADGARADGERADGERATGDRPHEIVGHLMVTHGAGAAERMAANLAPWPTGSTGIVAEGSDAADVVAAAVDRVAALGMTTVLVHSIDDDPDPVAFTEWVGREVAPRVSR
jgi:5,10-methylenetetrahydromethanopterin reductase